MKKTIALLLALVMLFAVAIFGTAFATAASAHALNDSMCGRSFFSRALRRASGSILSLSFWNS